MDKLTLYKETPESYSSNSNLLRMDTDLLLQTLYSALQKQGDILINLQKDVKHLKEINADNDIIISQLLSTVTKITLAN